MKLSDYLQHRAPEGERNHTLFCAILQAREEGWPTDKIEYTLTDCARRDGLSDWEILQTMKSAIARPIDLKSKKPNYHLDWDSPIGGDISETIERRVSKLDTTIPAKQQTIEFLRALFEPEEIIAYTNNAAPDKDGGLHPTGKGVYSRTCSDVIHEIEKADSPLIALDGDKKAGIWIRLNPFDGQGVADANVIEYRHCLVESDKISVEQQLLIIKQLKIPCSTITHSGKKSIHAAVKIDAGTDKKLYDARVKTLYEILNKAGMEVDRQNKNPSRLSRLAGVERGDQVQSLIGVNIGTASWAEFETLRRDTLYNLTDPQEWLTLRSSPPPLSPEIITGILRQGHKMLLGGPSKAGKSFALIQLAAAVAGGGDWLGHPCAKGRVLYVNMEIDEPSFIQRVLMIEPHIPFDAQNLAVWNLRGKVPSLGGLTQHLMLWLKTQRPFSLIILDPIYKINEGDENSAKDMTLFCNTIERVATETKAAVAFAHHFSKGQQGGKASIDRASGSGVFGRDPDAIGTMTETDSQATYLLEWTLREFASPPPTTLLFDWPVHKNLGQTDDEVTGKGGRPLAVTGEEITKAWHILGIADEIHITDLAEYFNVAPKTIRRKLIDLPEFTIKDSIVYKSNKINDL
jgi:hypothetical protein